MNGKETEKENIKTEKYASPGLAVVLDVISVCAVLLLFAFFHHVLPVIRSRAAIQAAETPKSVTAEVDEETFKQNLSPEPEPLPAPDTRTEWQIKFADKFTGEPVRTESGYSDREVSITIDTVTVGEDYDRVVYHVADIYVASLDNFKTYTANNELCYFSTQDVMEMDAAADALIAISGDFYAYQSVGFLIRNGQIYRQDNTGCSLCIMYYDGSMECVPTGTDYDVQEILDRNPYQIWNFGPSLLDAEGKAISVFPYVSLAVSFSNPRSAIGYYEPGHYCFVVVDGRQDGYSRGMTLPELAALFEELGCTCAYNLDGGGSAVMLFNHEKYSSQSNGAGRELSDIIVICSDTEEKTE